MSFSLATLGLSGLGSKDDLACGSYAQRRQVSHLSTNSTREARRTSGTSGTLQMKGKCCYQKGRWQLQVTPWDRKGLGVQTNMAHPRCHPQELIDTETPCPLVGTEVQGSYIPGGRRHQWHHHFHEHPAGERQSPGYIH